MTTDELKQKLTGFLIQHGRVHKIPTWDLWQELSYDEQRYYVECITKGLMYWVNPHQAVVDHSVYITDKGMEFLNDRPSG